MEETLLLAVQCTVHGVDDVRQTEIQTTETLVAEKNASEVELAIENLKSHKSSGIDQIPAELIKECVGFVDQSK